MVENNIGRLPVVGEGYCVVGVITRLDVFWAAVELYRAGDAGLYLTLKKVDRRGMLAGSGSRLLS